MEKWFVGASRLIYWFGLVINKTTRVLHKARPKIHMYIIHMYIIHNCTTVVRLTNQSGMYLYTRARPTASAAYRSSRIDSHARAAHFTCTNQHPDTPSSYTIAGLTG